MSPDICDIHQVLCPPISTRAAVGILEKAPYPVSPPHPVSPAETLRRRERTGRALGDEPFLRKIGRLLGRDLVPKKPGPPPKKPEKSKKKRR